MCLCLLAGSCKNYLGDFQRTWYQVGVRAKEEPDTFWGGFMRNKKLDYVLTSGSRKLSLQVCGSAGPSVG